MSENIILPFDDQILQLPSCLTVHRQIRPTLQSWTANEYLDCCREICQSKQSQLCGIVHRDGEDRQVIGLALYRSHPTTYDGIRFELHDFVVEEKQRGQGLGTRLLGYLIDQAKSVGTTQVILQCDLTNTQAHRFFFRHGFTVSSFGFCLRNPILLPSNERLCAIDITDLPAEENERRLIQAQEVFRQLRPNLPSDRQEFIDRIRTICRTGPARMVIVINKDADEDVLGISVYRHSHNIKYGKHLYCDDLVAKEDRRSAGVGRCLINAMKQELIRLGLPCLALDSGCQRGRAHKFYHREGFVLDQFEFTLFF